MDLSEELEFLPPEKRKEYQEKALLEAKWFHNVQICYFKPIVEHFVFVTFYTHLDKKIVPMHLHKENAKKEIEEKAAELLPTIKWKIFSGTQHQADFEFQESFQVWNSIKKSKICKFYYLLVRLERLHPDSHEVKCDECLRMIVGHRYKSTECADYDLCQTCESKSLHSEHAMLRIVRDGITHIPRYITANAPRFVFPNFY